MKYFLLIIPFLFLGCSDDKKKIKYEKMVADPSYTEITSKKMKHTLRQTVDIVDPFASGLVEIQQIGDDAMREVAKDRKNSRKTPNGRKD